MFRKLIQGILVLWGIVTLVFALLYLLGDPTDYLVGDQADAKTRQAVQAKYGFDQPLYVQYGRYLSGLVQLDPGRSFQTGKPVGPLLLSHLAGTAVLAVAAIALAALLGIGMGIVAAAFRDRWPDRLILFGSMLGVSAPSFFVAVILAWLLAIVLHPLTGLHVTGYLFEPAVFDQGHTVVWKNLLLPALALGIRPLAVFVQLTRSAMLDALGQPFIRTAFAKGLTFKQVLLGHAFPNALNPVITSVTGWFASILAGAFFVEYMFNWKGLGKLMIDALHGNDLPVITGVAALTGGMFVVINFLTDLLYQLTDKRVKG
jgi:peptide/nickel transport system permease protein